MTKMEERILMVKAMEFICRNINHEGVFMGWLMCGVADSDIKYGDFSTDKGEEDEAYWYAEDDDKFAELMGYFLEKMVQTEEKGGLYCGGVVSKDDEGKPWYVEKWYKEDLKYALERYGIPTTEENIAKLKKECKRLFDDKTDRCDAIYDVVYDLFVVKSQIKEEN